MFRIKKTRPRALDWMIERQRSEEFLAFIDNLPKGESISKCRCVILDKIASQGTAAVFDSSGSRIAVED
ncbi:MAG: hypothetical protein OXC66_04030 [Roseovarius sp.]|nr:hypothetical protein [Roseovarius sp.]